MFFAQVFSLVFIYALMFIGPPSYALVDPKTHVDVLTVSEILLAQEGKAIYVSTVTNGLLKSTDNGRTWTHINRGIINPLIYHMVQDPRSGRVLYAASWGGGVYKTEDGGETWIEMNQGLSTSAIGALALHPDRSELLVAASSQGVYRSDSGGQRWVPWNEGLQGEKELFYNAVAILPGKHSLVLLGTDRGIWQRRLSDRRWVSSGLTGLEVKTMKFDPKGSTVFAGTSNGGFFQGRWDPSSGQLQWSEINPELRKFSIQTFQLVHQGDAITIYIGTPDRGVFRSRDGGKSWQAANHGIEGEEIKALAWNSLHPAHLLAGTRDHGVYQTRDGGTSWVQVTQPTMPLAEVLEFTAKNAAASVKGRKSQPPPPAAFRRCNECHGWADPVLHLHPQTYWRVSPSRRDWRGTVERMARGNKWRNGEKTAVIEYMNRYYGMIP